VNNKGISLHDPENHPFNLHITFEMPIFTCSKDIGG